MPVRWSSKVNLLRVAVVFLGVTTSLVLFDSTAAATSDSLVAKIVEYSGEVSLRRGGQECNVEPWKEIFDGDTLNILTGARVRLAFNGGKVVETSGPRLLVVNRKNAEENGTLLGKLSLIARTLIFGTPAKADERGMAVREGTGSPVEPVAVPELIRPYDGELLIDTVVTFFCKPLAGIDLYRFNLYDSKGLIWQATTATYHVQYPQGTGPRLGPGQQYFWQVEALSGDHRLSSESSEFAIASQAKVDSVQSAIAELTSYTSGRINKRLVAAEMFFNAGLYSNALEELTKGEGDTDNVQLTIQRARLLLRLKDRDALVQLIPELLQATTSPPAKE